LFDEKFSYPSAAYKGDYLRAIATKLLSCHGEDFKISSAELFYDIPQDEFPDQTGDKDAHINALIVRCKELLSEPSYEFLINFLKQEIIQYIENDLHDFGVDFDNWFYEKSLITTDVI
jgi:arginyl-tRNA synthetase